MVALHPPHARQCLSSGRIYMAAAALGEPMFDHPRVRMSLSYSEENQPQQERDYESARHKRSSHRRAFLPNSPKTSNDLQ